MNKIATLYVLDPDTNILRPVQMPMDAGFSPLYEALECRVIESLRFDDRHLIFADEDGLRDGLTSFTIFDGYPMPLAGKLALACLDHEPFATPLLSIEDAAKSFQCARPLLDPVFGSEQSSDEKGFVFATVLRGFQTRIDKRAPTIVKGAA